MKRRREAASAAEAGPRLLDVVALLRARAPALAALETALTAVPGSLRVGAHDAAGIAAAQSALAASAAAPPAPPAAAPAATLPPRHLRRRTSSHRRHTLPRVLRGGSAAGAGASGAGCRAHRRRPSTLRAAVAAAAAAARLRAAGAAPALDDVAPVFRLPATHAWHAKRFHFGDLHGVAEERARAGGPAPAAAAAPAPASAPAPVAYRLPQARTDRGDKAAQRSALTAGVIYDASATSVVRLTVRGAHAPARLAALLGLVLDAGELADVAGLLGLEAAPMVGLVHHGVESRAKAARRRRAEARLRAAAPASVQSPSSWAVRVLMHACGAVLGGVIAPVTLLQLPPAGDGGGEGSAASLLALVPPAALGDVVAALRAAGAATTGAEACCMRLELATDFCIFSLAGVRCHEALAAALSGAVNAADAVLPPARRPQPPGGLSPGGCAALVGAATMHVYAWQPPLAGARGGAGDAGEAAPSPPLPLLLAQGPEAAAAWRSPPGASVLLWQACSGAPVAAVEKDEAEPSSQPWLRLLREGAGASCVACQPPARRPPPPPPPPPSPSPSPPPPRHAPPAATAAGDFLPLDEASDHGGPASKRRRRSAPPPPPPSFAFCALTHAASLCSSLRGAAGRARASAPLAPHRLDLLVPLAAARALWTALAAGAHGGRCAAVGAAEWAALQSALWPAAATPDALFPSDYPDAPAAAPAAAARAIDALAHALRRPPAQRVDWAVLGSPAPLAPLWPLLWPGVGDAPPPQTLAASLRVVRRRTEAAAALDAAVRACAAARMAGAGASAAGGALPAYLALPAGAPPPLLLPVHVVALGRGVPSAGWAICVPRRDDLDRLAAALAELAAAAAAAAAADTPRVAAAADADANDAPEISRASAAAAAARLLERLPPLAPVDEPSHAGCVVWAEAAGAAAATADPAAAATALARFHRAGLHAGMLLGAHAAGQSAITSRQLAGFVAAGAVSYYAGAAPRATGHVRLEVAAALRARADAEPIVAAHASCLALLEQAAQVPAPHAPQACHALARRLAWLSAGQPAAPRTLPADAVIALVRAPASSAYVWALLGPRLVG